MVNSQQSKTNTFITVIPSTDRSDCITLFIRCSSNSPDKVVAKDTETLLHTLLSSRLDYTNAFLVYPKTL